MEKMIDNTHIIVVSGAPESNVKQIINKCKSTSCSGHNMFLVSVLSTVYSTEQEKFLTKTAKCDMNYVYLHTYGLDCILALLL